MVVAIARTSKKFKLVMLFFGGIMANIEKSYDLRMLRHRTC